MCFGFVCSIFTDRVRSTRGGNIFSLSVSSHLGRGGGGYPIPGPGGGEYPIPGLGGGTPTQVQAGGYPIPGPGGGVPHPRSRGHPPGRGTPQQGAPPGVHPPCRGPAWGTPPGRGGLPGVPPPPPPQQEQHSVYLLRGGRYASCVQAGGLSCYVFFSFLGLSKVYIYSGITYLQKKKKKNQQKFENTCVFQFVTFL